MTKTLDLGWGNPYFLLELLDNCYQPTWTSVRDLTYAPDAGMEKLLTHVRKITEDTTGNHYEHYLITNGATQALSLIMKVWERDFDLRSVVTSELGYPYYPQMIDKTLTMTQKKVDLSNYENVSDKEMLIIDSPSNPLGEQFTRSSNKNVVWDAVYHNDIYNANKLIKPAHELYVGSLSKLLGITGARIGWIATNSKAEYDKLLHENLYDVATVSMPSQKLAIDILDKINLDLFTDKGRFMLDGNRQCLQRLAPLLGTDIQEVGMFYCAAADQKLFDLFDKSDVKYIKFKVKDQEFIRLNIGQTSQVIYDSVKRISKKDRRKK